MLKTLQVLLVSLAIASTSLRGQTSSPPVNLSSTSSSDAPKQRGELKSGQENITVSTNEPLKVQADVSKDWRDKVNWILSGLLVLIGGFGVWYAKRTLQAIESQLAEIRAAGIQTEAMIKHAGIQAEAARLNVQAFVQSERAWILEKLNFPNEIPRLTPLTLGTVLLAAFTVENVGKQPAFVRSIQTRFHTYPRSLPDKPEYLPGSYFSEAAIGTYGRLLVSGKPWTIETFLEDGSLDDEKVNQIERGQLQLYVYGRIDYESAGLKCVNQFGYSWNPLLGPSLEGDKPGFRKDGPAEYNRHV